MVIFSLLLLKLIFSKIPNSILHNLNYIMRILVRYCLPFGNYSTAAVEIDLNKQIVVQLRK